MLDYVSFVPIDTINVSVLGDYIDRRPFVCTNNA